jgi:hypothetical protein
VPSGRYYKTSNFARTQCEPGYRCVAGVRSACSSDNEYQNGTQSNSCVTVTTGYYTTPIGGSARTGQTQCEPGYYCAGGVRWVCSGHNEYVTHTHSANDHRARGSEDIACCSRFCGVVQRPHRSYNQGVHLLARCLSHALVLYSQYYFSDHLLRDSRYAASSGQTSCDNVGAGYYTSTTSAPDTSPNSAQIECEAGYYCQQGVRSPCQSATQFQNLTRQTSCQTVAAGHYSFPVGNVQHTQENPCELGYSCLVRLQYTASPCAFQSPFALITTVLVCIPTTAMGSPWFVSQ